MTDARGPVGERLESTDEQLQITPEMQREIGVPSEPWIFEVTAAGVRSYARGVGYTDAVFFDEDAARAAGYPALPAPPGYLGTPVFIPGKSPDSSPYHPDHPATRKFGLRSVLAGGVETHYERIVVGGDVLIATSCIDDLTVKHSRSIGPMLIVSARSEFRDLAGGVVAVERSWTIRY